MSSTAGEIARIGLLGRGTVGSAFEQLVTERADAVARDAGRRPEISGILTTGSGDFDQILESSDVIVELIGGTDPARDYVIRALMAGKHVVTANKQLLAEHGEELLDAARAGGAQLRFEAAIAGAIPIVRVMLESLASIRIEKVSGIVNGTTNYILTEMAKSGLSYDEALKQAQDLGYAEADPTADVGGGDAAAKMAILALLAFGTPITLDQVDFEGITEIQPHDLAYAKELGLSLKLIGVSERVDDAYSVRVFPCFLYSGHPLAHVDGPFNAIMVQAPTITEITMSGPGAGGIETASAVLGDLVSVLTGSSLMPEATAEVKLADDVHSAFYLHLEVADKPGVLARITEILGDTGVSVRSVLQTEMDQDARLVMVMHRGSEARFKAALEQIAELDFLRSAPRSIRVIEEEFV